MAAGKSAYIRRIYLHLALEPEHLTVSYVTQIVLLTITVHVRLIFTTFATVTADGAVAGKSAYIRYVVPTPDDEEATVEYDLDEEDEQWLQQHSRHVCARFSAASDDGNLQFCCTYCYRHNSASACSAPQTKPLFLYISTSNCYVKDHVIDYARLSCNWCLPATRSACLCTCDI